MKTSREVTQEYSVDGSCNFERGKRWLLTRFARFLLIDYRPRYYLH